MREDLVGSSQDCENLFRNLACEKEIQYNQNTHLTPPPSQSVPLFNNIVTICGKWAQLYKFIIMYTAEYNKNNNWKREDQCEKTVKVYYNNNNVIYYWNI